MWISRELDLIIQGWFRVVTIRRCLQVTRATNSRINSPEHSPINSSLNTLQVTTKSRKWTHTIKGTSTSTQSPVRPQTFNKPWCQARSLLVSATRSTLSPPLPPAVQNAMLPKRPNATCSKCTKTWETTPPPTPRSRPTKPVLSWRARRSWANQPWTRIRRATTRISILTARARIARRRPISSRNCFWATLTGTLQAKSRLSSSLKDSFTCSQNWTPWMSTVSSRSRTSTRTTSPVCSAWKTLLG